MTRFPVPSDPAGPRRDAADPVEPARRMLAAGIPLTLVLDLAAGDRLDSRAILDAEQVASMVATERAERAAEGSNPGETDEPHGRNADIA